MQHTAQQSLSRPLSEKIRTLLAKVFRAHPVLVRQPIYRVSATLRPVYKKEFEPYTIINPLNGQPAKVLSRTNLLDGKP